MAAKDLIERLTEFARRHPTDAVLGEMQRAAGVADRNLAFDDPSYSDAGVRSHFTATAWLMNPERTHVALTHHRKFHKWIQLGGHYESTDPTIAATATREGFEESGLPVTLLSDRVVDIDIHVVPARPNEPEHRHYDVRFVLETPMQPLNPPAHENKDVRWVPIAELETFTTEESVLRLRDRALAMVAASGPTLAPT